MPAKRANHSPWVTTATLANELGCGQKYVREQLKDDVFRPNQEYRNINPTAWRPTYRWHLERCIQRLQEVSVDQVG